MDDSLEAAKGVIYAIAIAFVMWAVIAALYVGVSHALA